MKRLLASVAAAVALTSVAACSGDDTPSADPTASVSAASPSPSASSATPSEPLPTPIPTDLPADDPGVDWAERALGDDGDAFVQAVGQVADWLDDDAWTPQGLATCFAIRDGSGDVPWIQQVFRTDDDQLSEEQASEVRTAVLDNLCPDLGT